jgi:spore maturation protein CgeB
MDYRPIVRDAVEQGLPLSIYGKDWRQFVRPRFVKGDYLPNAELGAAYRSAGVVLNDHWSEMREQGFVSNRLFDAVASGARVVSDEVDGLADLFGDSVQVWRTPEDLTRLSSLRDPDAVFGDDEQRRSVAARVAREHSFAARAERLVQIAVEARRERGFLD